MKLQEFNNNTELYLEWRSTPRSLSDLYDDAIESYNELDSSFFWLDNGKIKDDEFADNAMNIIAYLKSAIES